MAVKERKEKLDVPENKLKPSSISDSAMHVFVSFTLKELVHFGLFLQWLGFCFCIQKDTLLLVYLICQNTAGQVSALPNTQPFYKVLQGSTYFPLFFLVHRLG